MATKVPSLKQFKALAEQVRELMPLKKEVEYLRSVTPDWVDTPAAERLAGIKRQALKAEREREGTPLVFKRDGPKGGKILYSAYSIHLLNESKTIKQHPLLQVA